MGVADTVCTDLEQEREATVARVGEQSAGIVHKVTLATDSCKQANMEVLERKEALAGFVEVHVEASKTGWAEYEEEVRTRGQERSRGAQEQLEQWQGAAKEARSKLEEAGGALRLEVVALGDREEAAVRRLASEVEQLGERGEVVVEELSGRLGEERETVETFVQEVMLLTSCSCYFYSLIS